MRVRRCGSARVEGTFLMSAPGTGADAVRSPSPLIRSGTRGGGPGGGPVTRPPVQRSAEPAVRAQPDLGALRLPELRALRRDAQSDEADLSYVRRMLQGRIDILRAELARRTDPEAPVLDRLLCDPRRRPSRHRARSVRDAAAPRGEGYRRLATGCCRGGARR
ncbi:ABC transporter substrate-binding protein [Streptomyces tanashiensis]